MLKSNMPELYPEVLRDGDLGVFYTPMWKRDCVYVWHTRIGWHIVGFL
jgi:hypothetical protein